jgi:hypothetical protein
LSASASFISSWNGFGWIHAIFIRYYFFWKAKAWHQSHLGGGLWLGESGRLCLLWSKHFIDHASLTTCRLLMVKMLTHFWMIWDRSSNFRKSVKICSRDCLTIPQESLDFHLQSRLHGEISPCMSASE